MYQDKVKLHERERHHKKGELKSIVLDVTNKCNMKCKFCYAEPFADVNPISLDVLKKALDEAYEMGVTHYCLMGGEVCADYDRLTAIIPLLHPDETYINLVTNGWGMTRERIHELKGLQVDKITFSLDSGIEKEHDSNRMTGSFKRIMVAIDNVKELGLHSAISTVVTHESLYSEGFNRAYEIAKEKGIRFEVQIAEPVGRWEANKECLITKQDADYIYDMYQNAAIMDNGQIQVKRDLYRGDCVCCPAGTEFMAITADGNFMPCNFIQATLGNIKDKSLRKMRDDLLKSKWFSEDYSFCILGECDEYYENIVVKYKDTPKPLNAYQVFGIEE